MGFGDQFAAARNAVVNQRAQRANTLQNQQQLELRKQELELRQRQAAQDAKQQEYINERQKRMDAITAAMNRQGWQQNDIALKIAKMDLAAHPGDLASQQAYRDAQIQNTVANTRHAGALADEAAQRAKQEGFTTAALDKQMKAEADALVAEQTRQDKAVAAHKAAAFDVLPDIESIVTSKERQYGIKLPQIVRSNAASFAAGHLSRGADPEAVFTGIDRMLDAQLSGLGGASTLVGTREMLDAQSSGLTGASQIPGVPDNYDFGPAPMGLYRTYSPAAAAADSGLGGIAGAAQSALVDQYRAGATGGPGAIGGVLTGAADLALRGLAAPFVGSDYSGFTTAANRPLGDWLAGRVGFLESARSR